MKQLILSLLSVESISVVLRDPPGQLEAGSFVSESSMYRLVKNGSV